MNVLHANDIPWDNRLENLRWGTQSENLKEATVNGRNVNANKTHCKTAMSSPQRTPTFRKRRGAESVVTRPRWRGSAKQRQGS